MFASEQSWIGGMHSIDGVNFVGDPRLVMARIMRHDTYENHTSLHLSIEEKGVAFDRQIAFPRRRSGPHRARARTSHFSMSHNLAVAYINESFVFVGGNSGIWISRSRSLWFSPGVPSRGVAGAELGAGWSELRFIIGGNHSGCVERRDVTQMTWLTPSVCEYDGRLSLVHFRGMHLLYTRANPGAQGQRFVQVATSRDSYLWSPFKMINIDGYNFRQGNVYFWAVQVSMLKK